MSDKKPQSHCPLVFPSRSGRPIPVRDRRTPAEKQRDWWRVQYQEMYYPGSTGTPRPDRKW